MRQDPGPQIWTPLTPYTRVQRVLHRLRICRWHGHQQLTVEMIDRLLEEHLPTDGPWLFISESAQEKARQTARSIDRAWQEDGDA